MELGCDKKLELNLSSELVTCNRFSLSSYSS
jgi:hypothetical protein